MKKIIVIGAGASGMMAAVSAKSFGGKDVDVYVLERNEYPGKKILATGNGKCNFTNIVQGPLCYRSSNPDFAWDAVLQFPAQSTIRFFLELGIYSVNRNGYPYPASGQATSVRDVLTMEMIRLGVHVLTNVFVEKVEAEGNGFCVYTKEKTFAADKVILACGGKAASYTGSDGNGYAHAEMFGHTIVPVLPALVQLRCKEKVYKKLSGVRSACKISLFSHQECVAQDSGELQLTDYGISGIPVFQVSRFAAQALREGKEVSALLDFAPDFSKEQFLDFLKRRIQSRPKKNVEEFLIGCFHKKLCDCWIYISRIDKAKLVIELTDDELEKLVRIIKEFKTTVVNVNSFDQAQVCAGGVDTKEVCVRTMESKLKKGLFFAGEILDVDGMCGGYNLQWAWSSGYLAGKHAAQ